MKKFITLILLVCMSSARAELVPASGSLPRLAEMVQKHMGLDEGALGEALAEDAVVSGSFYQRWLQESAGCTLSGFTVLPVSATQGSAGGTFRYLVTRTASGPADTCLGAGQLDGVAFQIAIVTAGEISDVAKTPNGRVVWQVVPLNAD
jgi:hypothetical protein